MNNIVQSNVNHYVQPLQKRSFSLIPEPPTTQANTTNTQTNNKAQRLQSVIEPIGYIGTYGGIFKKIKKQPILPIQPILDP
tara:strand:+ start:216 stop:458 length:243 start_codon:yes stop_codon:yes gene_type:complete